MNEAGDLNLLPPDAPSVPLPAATAFAPAGRVPPEEICRQAQVIQTVPLLKQALDAMPCLVLVLNRQRQIVAANEALLALLKATLGQVLERRPGETLGCLHAQKGPDGCGTSLHCMTCGAVGAVLDCQVFQQSVVRECRVLVHTPFGATPLDLRVTATPFQVGADCFVIVALEDISHAKRLAVLQRTFFHDVLNTAGCIQGYTQYLLDEALQDRETCGLLEELTRQLIESIRAQRDLIQAETGDLKLNRSEVHVRAVLDQLRLQYRNHPVAIDRTIQLGAVWDGTLRTDRQLLLRVLGNMLKNALEATAAGNAVTLGCTASAAGVQFSVHNLEVMPRETQLQIFQRSFSTKGQAGRGIGTYSMKLLGERYLGGRVGFTSQTPQGTTFSITLPHDHG
jgi:nitrogen-specific signal transduction histidine kinase